MFLIYLSSYNTSKEGESNYTSLIFNYPTANKNRKFNLKIGKVTDNNILAKIQKNDYEGITDLLKYAQTHDAVYSKDLLHTNQKWLQYKA